MLAEKGHHVPIGAPDNILDRGSCKLSEHFLLLNVEKHDRRRGGEEKRGGAAVKYFVGLDRAFDSLRKIV